MVQNICNYFLLLFFIVILLKTNARVINIQYELINISSTGCSIDINEDLEEPQPLFIIPGTEIFWNPRPNGIVYIPRGEIIEFYCSDSFDSPLPNYELIKAECLSGDKFLIKNEIYYFSEIVCTSHAYNVARRTNDTCHNNATLVEIGFELYDGRFLRTMEVCHNEIIESTLYVHHTLNPSSNEYQTGTKRIRFKEGDFYGDKDVNYLYSREIQKETIGDLLDGNHEKYFNESKSIYLARGHLSAKVDHIYGSQQRSTFYFINAAPQWQIFNAGNWLRIEDGVRQYVAKKKLYVDCYTGTWDIMKLPDINENLQELYLSYDDDDNLQIPVPKFYYRVVIDRKTKYGIVLIGVNSPHVTIDEIENDHILCNDVSDKINWIKWKKDDILLGYSYACDVREFMKIVDHLPKLEIKGLLI